MMVVRTVTGCWKQTDPRVLELEPVGLADELDGGLEWKVVPSLSLSQRMLEEEQVQKKAWAQVWPCDLETLIGHLCGQTSRSGLVVAKERWPHVLLQPRPLSLWKYATE